MSGLGPEELRSRLERALRTAMKAKDTVAVAALRSVLAAIANAEAVPAPTGSGITGPSRPAARSEHIAGGAPGLAAGEAARRRLTAAETAGLVRGEITEREAAARQYAATGHDGRAGRLRAEARAIEVALADGDPA